MMHNVVKYCQHQLPLLEYSFTNCLSSHNMIVICMFPKCLMSLQILLEVITLTNLLLWRYILSEKQSHLIIKQIDSLDNEKIPEVDF